jgi:UDP-glucose 4-epimerase
MKRVAITGISGYIGSRLLSRLEGMEDVERVIGVDVRPPKDSPPKLKFYCQDISEPLGDIFIENEVDSAVHLAFVLRPTHDRTGARKTDIGGAVNFLESCRQAQVKHVLYLSSHTIYGAHPDSILPLKEDSPPRPLPGFQYSCDKDHAEREFRDFATTHNDTCVTILRSCPVIGPNVGDSVVTSMFKSIMVFVAGYDPPMQFVHEDDLVELVVTFLGQKKAGIFNVAGDGDIRYSEIARLCRRRTIALPERLLRLLMGVSWALRLQNESPASGLDFIKYPPLVSTEKLRSEVGFQFRYSSRDAVASFISAR